MRATVVCERARAQASLELDDELSQLERRVLASHLSRCPECSAFVSDVSTFTQDLRKAPFEMLRRPVVVSRLRRTSARRLHVGVAAAVALAALGLGSQLASRPTPEVAVRGEVVQFQTRLDLERELAIIDLGNDRIATTSRASVL